MQSITPKSAIALVTMLFLLILGASGCKENPVDASDDVAARSAADGAEGVNEIEGVGATIPFADAEVFFEFNSTDNDLGLQVFLDAEGWEKVTVRNPDIGRILRFEAVGMLADLGITELRFESAEPSPAEVLATFPPGEYLFRGRTVEGDKLVGEGELSHDLLPPFDFTPADGDIVDPEEMVVEWSAPGAELVEIIIESEDTDATLDIIVEDDEGELEVPEQFLEPNAEYKLELLAIAENGNKTIVEHTFTTSSGDDDEADGDEDDEDEDDDEDDEDDDEDDE